MALKWLTVLLLGGCTAIGHVKPPADWPALTTTVHRVTSKQMRDVCNKYAPWWGVIEACATLNFDRMTCDIWLDRDNLWHLEHERLHCLGHDHVGDATLANAWAKWKMKR